MIGTMYSRKWTHENHPQLKNTIPPRAQRMIYTRTQARLMGQETYRGRACAFDGCTTRYVETEECAECVRYRKSVQALRIDGIDARQKGERKPITEEVNGHTWSEEEREARSAAIKNGIKRKKNREKQHDNNHKAST